MGLFTCFTPSKTKEPKTPGAASGIYSVASKASPQTSPTFHTPTFNLEIEESGIDWNIVPVQQETPLAVERSLEDALGQQTPAPASSKASVKRPLEDALGEDSLGAVSSSNPAKEELPGSEDQHAPDLDSKLRAADVRCDSLSKSPRDTSRDASSTAGSPVTPYRLDWGENTPVATPMQEYHDAEEIESRQKMDEEEAVLLRKSEEEQAALQQKVAEEAALLKKANEDKEATKQAAALRQAREDAAALRQAQEKAAALHASMEKEEEDALQRPKAEEKAVEKAVEKVEEKAEEMAVEKAEEEAEEKAVAQQKAVEELAGLQKLREEKAAALQKLREEKAAALQKKEEDELAALKKVEEEAAAAAKAAASKAEGEAAAAKKEEKEAAAAKKAEEEAAEEAAAAKKAEKKAEEEAAAAAAAAASKAKGEAASAKKEHEEAPAGNEKKPGEAPVPIRTARLSVKKDSALVRIKSSTSKKEGAGPANEKKPWETPIPLRTKNDTPLAKLTSSNSKKEEAAAAKKGEAPPGTEKKPGEDAPVPIRTARLSVKKDSALAKVKSSTSNKNDSAAAKKGEGPGTGPGTEKKPAEESQKAQEALMPIGLKSVPNSALDKVKFSTTWPPSKASPASASPLRAAAVQRFGGVAPREVIQQVADDDPELTSVDLSGNATIQVKPIEYTELLCEAMKTNTHVREILLARCELRDDSATILGNMLKTSQTLQVLGLEGNNIKTEGGIAIAQGLALNSGLRALNLLSQQQAFGEKVLTEFVKMFATNVVLLKLTWRVDSRQSFSLNRLLTRNNEINRRLKAERDDIDDVLPEALKGKATGLVPYVC